MKCPFDGHRHFYLAQIPDLPFTNDAPGITGGEPEWNVPAVGFQQTLNRPCDAPTFAVAPHIGWYFASVNRLLPERSSIPSPRREQLVMPSPRQLAILKR